MSILSWDDFEDDQKDVAVAAKPAPLSSAAPKESAAALVSDAPAPAPRPCAAVSARFPPGGRGGGYGPWRRTGTDGWAGQWQVIAGSVAEWENQGKTVVVVSVDGAPTGLVAVRDEQITDTHRTRLWLNDATRQVLATGLGLLGVGAPERM